MTTEQLKIGQTFQRKHYKTKQMETYEIVKIGKTSSQCKWVATGKISIMDNEHLLSNYCKAVN